MLPLLLGSYLKLVTLLVVATLSSCPTELPKSTKVKSHGNKICDVIICAHGKCRCTDQDTDRRIKRKAILGPAGHVVKKKTEEEAFLLTGHTPDT